MADFPSPLGPTSSTPPSGPALLCVLALAGCQTVSWLPPFGPQTEPVDPNPTEVGECPPDSQVTWDTFAKGFLQTQCTQCHSALYEGDNRRGAPDGVDFDTYEGAYNDLPYFALAEAVFALTYAHRKVDIIPDSIVDLGHADDSSVVRAVILQNERAFEKYARAQGVDWKNITAEP